MLTESVSQALQQTTTALEPLAVPVVLIGGASMPFYGHTRFTHDIDFLLSIATTRVDEVVARLQRARFKPRNYPPAVALGGVDLIQFDYQTPGQYGTVQVDIQIAKSEYHRQLLARAVKFTFEVGQRPIDVAASEDLVLLKLIAGRIIDLADVAALLRNNADRMDLEYLRYWARREKVTRELRQMWEEAFPGESFPEPPPKDELD